MISKEFYKQIDVICEERGLSVEQLLDSFRKGLISAYKKTYNNTSVRVEFRPEKNEILMYSQRLVVASFEEVDPECEVLPILLSEAKKINSRAKVGEILDNGVYKILVSDSKVMVPLIDVYVKSVDLENKKIECEGIEGLVQ